MPVVSHRELKRTYTGIAKALGTPDDEAVVFADCMTRADLRGMPTQGTAVV